MEKENFRFISYAGSFIVERYGLKQWFPTEVAFVIASGAVSFSLIFIFI